MKSPPTQARPWPRTEKFSLSETGLSAELAYQAALTASRSTGGRASFDAARASWAKSFGIEPEDGLCLAELLQGSVRLGDLVASLDSCGTTRQDVESSLSRLLGAGLVNGQS